MADSRERIAKVIARSGLCSRREAERWIEAGRVEVDGEAIDRAALNVTENNIILVDGKRQTLMGFYFDEYLLLQVR